MNSRYAYFIVCLVLALLPNVFGCGQVKRPDGMPELYPVTITVLQNGTPLEGARVGSFPADTALAQWGGGGTTDASGKITMHSYGFKGLVAGEHSITVSKEYFTRPPGMETADKDEYEFFVDTNFWSASTTPLRIDVKRGSQDFTLEVEPFNPATYNERRFGKKLKK